MRGSVHVHFAKFQAHRLLLERMYIQHIYSLRGICHIVIIIRARVHTRERMRFCVCIRENLSPKEPLLNIFFD